MSSIMAYHHYGMFAQTHGSRLHNEHQKFCPSHGDSHKCLNISMEIHLIATTTGLPGPISCAESHDIIHSVMGLLVPASDVKTRQIVAFSILCITDIHMFNGYQDRQTFLVNAVLALLDALISRYHPFCHGLLLLAPQAEPSPIFAFSRSSITYVHLLKGTTTVRQFVGIAY